MARVKKRQDMVQKQQKEQDDLKKKNASKITTPGKPAAAGKSGGKTKKN